MTKKRSSEILAMKNFSVPPNSAPGLRHYITGNCRPYSSSSRETTLVSSIIVVSELRDAIVGPKILATI